MKVKLKICDGCGERKMIWKNHLGERFCQTCWNKRKPKSVSKPTKSAQLSPRSPYRKTQDTKYIKLRKEFLLNHPICEAHVPGICNHASTDIHHTYAGASRQLHYLEVNTWLSVCRNCHDWIHENPISARNLNLLK